MDLVKIIFILVLIVTALFFAIFALQTFLKIFEVRKEIAEANTKVEYKTKFVKSDYENDFKVVNSVIQDYVKNISLVELKEFFESSYIINEKVFQDLAKKVTYEVWKALSDEYKELLGQYVSDPMMFIYEKVYYQSMDIVLSINKNNVEKLRMQGK